MNINTLHDLKNTLLVAMPSMQETWFAQSLTLICDHTAESTLGIVVNKPLGMQLGELFEQLDIECDDLTIKGMPVFKGGPVQEERGFILHTGYGLADNPAQIGEDLFLSTSRAILNHIASGNGPDRFLVALGYAGWGEHQLVDEIIANAWLNAPGSNDLIFDLPTHYRWDQAAARMGIDIRHFCSAAGHA